MTGQQPLAAGQVSEGRGGGGAQKKRLSTDTRGDSNAFWRASRPTWESAAHSWSSGYADLKMMGE